MAGPDRYENVGSGIDVTILQLAPSATSAHFYAIGHALIVGGSSPNAVDFFEVSDLTIDCNLGGYSGTAACGAVRVMGNHAKVRRIRVKNWGTLSTSRPCFVITAVTGNPGGAGGLNGVEDCGIEECIADAPYSVSNTGPVTIFHAGGPETASENVSGYGIAPYIRNCFADGGQASPFPNQIQGVSMAWCKAGVVEGNQVHNMMYGGPFQQAMNAQDVVARNNWCKNVNKGIVFGGLGASRGSGALSVTAGVATVSLANSGLALGDIVMLTSSGAFNGIVVTVASANSSQFTFNTALSGSDTVTVNKVFGITESLVIEGNTVELATATSGQLIGIHTQDFAATGVLQGNPAAYVFQSVIVRDNKIRYLDGTPPASGYVGYGIQVNSAANLIVRNNVVDSEPANPIQNARCGSVSYFNNLTSNGTLIQGWDGDTGTLYDELSTEIDDALVIGLFNRKS